MVLENPPDSFASHLQELISTTWKDRGVLGFLANNADETLMNATETINKGLEEVDG